MTIEEALKRIIFRWWLILILTLIFTLTFFNWSTSNTYLASIGLGISFNSQDFNSVNSQNVNLDSNINRGPEYTYSLEQFSLYLASRFNSIEIQSMIAEEAGLNIRSFSPIQAFYNVQAQNGGYISINYETVNKELAEKFIDSVKIIYEKLIITERQIGELNAFQIVPKTEFLENIVPINKPTQFQILPSVAGFIVGITIAVLWPFKKELGK